MTSCHAGSTSMAAVASRRKVDVKGLGKIAMKTNAIGAILSNLGCHDRGMPAFRHEPPRGHSDPNWSSTNGKRPSEISRRLEC